MTQIEGVQKEEDTASRRVDEEDRRHCYCLNSVVDITQNEEVQKEEDTDRYLHLMI